MSTTAELRRTWKLLSWRERAVMVRQSLKASSFGGAVPAFLGLALDRIHGGHSRDWIEVALYAAAIGAGAFVAVWMFHARPGSSAWRRR